MRRKKINDKRLTVGKCVVGDNNKKRMVLAELEGGIYLMSKPASFESSDQWLTLADLKHQDFTHVCDPNENDFSDVQVGTTIKLGNNDSYAQVLARVGDAVLLSDHNVDITKHPLGGFMKHMAQHHDDIKDEIKEHESMTRSWNRAGRWFTLHELDAWNFEVVRDEVA